jgi:pimeloyl-ACP methyl ester carboxylesterase
MRVARVARRDGFDEVAPIFFTEERLRHIIRSAYGPNPQPDDVIENYVKDISVTDAFSVVTTYFSESFCRMPEHYAEIGVPVLIVAGDEDPHNPLSLAERPAREIPGAELKLLPGLAHCPHEENPSLFNPLLLDFLSRRNQPGKVV